MDDKKSNENKKIIDKTTPKRKIKIIDKKHEKKARRIKAERKNKRNILKAKRQKIKKRIAENKKNKFVESRPELLANDFSTFIYSIGFIFGRIFVESYQSVKAIVIFIVYSIYFLFKSLYIKLDKSYSNSLRAFRSEWSYFKTEVKSAFKNIYSGEHTTFEERKGVFKRYVKKAFERHPQMLKKIISVASPVIVAVILAGTIVYWSNVTFALSVNCNGKDIGYIADESTFVDAKKIITDNISQKDNENLDKALTDVKLKIALVKPEKLEDAKTLSEKIITNSSNKITQACGVYIDGNFLCAVKNEMDAVGVFNNILDKYQEENPDGIVGFVEDIVYVQGVYEDDPKVLWDTSKLEQKLKTKRDATSVYTVKDGDTPEGVAKENGLTLAELEKLNPGNLTVIRAGEKLFISEKVNFVNVKVTKTVVETKEIPYDTEKIEDSSMLKGKQKVTTNGQKGSVQITYLDTYVEGTLKSHSEVSRKVLSEPVKEVVKVGTKKPTYSSSSYYAPYSVAKYGSMVWPAVGLRTITCPFGSYGHRGVDIAGGSAYGKTVVAAKSGTVVAAGWSGSYGNRIVISHGGGLQTLYAHLSHINVSTGQSVSAGQAIGKVGSTGNSTGPHLHFEVQQGGRLINPMSYIG